jgi:hypothetical protein
MRDHDSVRQMLEQAAAKRELASRLVLDASALERIAERVRAARKDGVKFETRDGNEG